MVRGPAALLGGTYAATLALFVAAPVLPAIGGTGHLNTAISDWPAMVALTVCVLAMLPLRDEILPLALLALGSGLLGGAFTAADVIPLANMCKVAFAGALGLALARGLADPAVVVAVPLFVAAIDILSVVGGPTALLSREEGRSAEEFLTFYLPAWGGGRAGVLGVADLVFAAFFASCAWRFGLRRRATAAALLAALPATLAIELALGGTIPAIPLLAAALLLPNLDLLPAMLRGQRRG